MHLKDSASAIALMCVLLASCGDEAATAPESLQHQARVLPPEPEILARVYDNAYSVPAGFFVDERATTPRSYTLHHVKDTSVSFELCSDDFAQAQSWEELDNESRQVRGQFIGRAETDRYFEFIRELSYDSDLGNVSDVTSPGFSRVFKCSSVSRDGVDRNLRTGYAGTLNNRPVSAGSIRTFTEYMWQFTFFTESRKKVVQSFSSESEHTFNHTLVLALANNQGSERCDRIDVIDWVFSADKSTGEIRKTYNPLYSFEARLVNGKPEACSP